MGSAVRVSSCQETNGLPFSDKGLYVSFSQLFGQSDNGSGIAHTKILYVLRMGKG